MARSLISAVRRTCSAAAHQMRTLHQRRATIEPQAEAADCGYVSISAAMSLLGRGLLVDEIKALTGTTTRGLTLRQVRDGLRACGAEADVIAFDVNKGEAYPCTGIVLLSRGHYIVIAGKRGDRFEIFDPQLGWLWTTKRKLARSCSGFGIHIRGVTGGGRTRSRAGRRSLPAVLKVVLRNRTGRLAMAWFAIAQLLTLALPLLSMWSVDRSLKGLSLSTLGVVSIGFAALSLTNIAVSLCGELVQNRARRYVTVALNRLAFDSLTEKPAGWFDRHTSASLQNRISSVNVQSDFYLTVSRAIGSLTVTMAVGLAVLLFISPWLLLPGICSLILSVLVDIAFQRGQRDLFGSVVEATQRRQAFILDTLAQLPVIARFGAVGAARVRYAAVVRAAATAEARLQSVRGWRTALGGLAKSADTLFFVILSAALMGTGHFTIGGFVALGAYKDLLANSAGSLFQLVLQRQSQKVHELQSAPLLTSGGRRNAAETSIVRGDVEFADVHFKYGSLDRPVLNGVSFRAEREECTVIRGPSGAGKSTIARLIVGALAPTSGSVHIDGHPVADTMSGMGAVLQGDRLIGGTIRDNIALFRPGVTDSMILGALKRAAVDDFVLSLPMGLNTFVGEAVGGLSGGQRQRLLIARALLLYPRLVVFDEATSSLEVDIETKILAEISRSGATTILISHRPEVWRLADRLYTMSEEGLLEQEQLFLSQAESEPATHVTSDIN